MTSVILDVVPLEFQKRSVSQNVLRFDNIRARVCSQRWDISLWIQHFSKFAIRYLLITISQQIAFLLLLGKRFQSSCMSFLLSLRRDHVSNCAPIPTTYQALIPRWEMSLWTQQFSTNPLLNMIIRLFLWRKKYLILSSLGFQKRSQKSLKLSSSFPIYQSLQSDINNLRMSSNFSQQII